MSATRAIPVNALPWYRTLDARQWRTLFAANLGWLFDGYETYAVILTVAVAMHQLLARAQSAQIPFFAGVTIAITLLGWGFGGILGGVLSDYFGRKRVMIGAILAYSLLTGLTAFAWSWESFALLRFAVGLALGSEWGTGTAMMAEMWPDNARGKGAGLMQCGLGIGFFLASAVWFFVSTTGPGAWRWMFVLGILPALATIWIRTGIAEPEKWEAIDRARREARAARKRHAPLSAEQRNLTTFTLAQLFRPPYLRLTIVALAMSLTTTLGWWGISTWIPPYVASLAAKQGLLAAQWAAVGGIAYNVGGIAGYALFGFFADAWGRRPVTIVYFAGALILTPVLFLWTPHNLWLVLVVCAVNAFFTNGQYTWMPVWLPEIYPTRIRATAVAFAFNAPRFIAFLGPLFAGALIANLGGYGVAATTVGAIYVLGLVAAPFFPETRGRPLPEG